MSGYPLTRLVKLIIKKKEENPLVKAHIVMLK